MEYCYPEVIPTKQNTFAIKYLCAGRTNHGSHDCSYGWCLSSHIGQHQIFGVGWQWGRLYFVQGLTMITVTKPAQMCL